MVTTPYPFVSGAVLTASQLNSTYNVPVSTKTASYTLVAADGGTRVTMNSASATTITVNTSLFSAGDSVEINNTAAGGTCTITAGTATVTTSGSLALVANAGGTLYFTSASAAIFFSAGVAASASALTLITAVSFTTQSTVSFATGVFTSTFSNYLVVLNITSSAGDAQQLMRVNNAGTPRANDYFGGALRASSAGASAVTGSASAGSFNMAGTSSTNGFFPAMTFTVYEPANASIKTRISGFGFGANDSNLASGILFGGVYNVAEANDGLTFNTSTTITGFYKVYGIQNS